VAGVEFFTNGNFYYSKGGLQSTSIIPNNILGKFSYQVDGGYLLRKKNTVGG
jgi:hypothetical protein